jgi:5-methylcytosine-specific restriction endonuclease McrA
MAFSKSTIKKLKQNGRFDCCEFCGACIPRLENKGLQASHVVSDQCGGPDHPDNAIVLCNHCAEAFDRFLKAKIAKAFDHANSAQGTKFSAPNDWLKAEGRRATGDVI